MGRRKGSSLPVHQSRLLGHLLDSILGSGERQVCIELPGLPMRDRLTGLQGGFGAQGFQLHEFVVAVELAGATHIIVLDIRLIECRFDEKRVLPEVCEPVVGIGKAYLERAGLEPGIYPNKPVAPLDMWTVDIRVGPQHQAAVGLQPGRVGFTGVLG